jgi:hypothetical protein
MICSGAHPKPYIWYQSENDGKIGWDINYFTFDFNYIETGNVLTETNGSDACFTRCVKK